jgi:deoxyadenosine/deoxycytidine kinase
MAPIIISVEGNIGSGKSTFVGYLKDNLNNNIYGRVCFLQEPVDEWNEIRDSTGTTILERYYEDQKTHAFAFQMMAFITRLNKITQAIREEYDVIIMERSLQTDRLVFAQMLKDEDKITDIEFAIYTKWFDSFLHQIPTQYVVYLQTNPSVALERVNRRGRVGEDIPLEYLMKCHKYHEAWRDESTLTWITIDANHDINDRTDTTVSEWQAMVVSLLFFAVLRTKDRPAS